MEFTVILILSLPMVTMGKAETREESHPPSDFTMSPSVETISGVAVAAAVVLIAVILAIVYKYCWAKKRRSIYIDSSLGKDEKVQRVSTHSFTQTVSETPSGIPPRELILTSPALNPTHNTSGLGHRHSEPIIPLSDKKSDLEKIRPYSDTTNSNWILRDRNESHSDGDIWRTPSGPRTRILSYIEEQSLYKPTTSETALLDWESNLDLTKSKGSGDGDDIPAWSMESTEYQTGSTTSLIKSQPRSTKIASQSHPVFVTSNNVAEITEL